MSVWGKIIGGTAGFAIGGPIGAILGVMAGNIFDKSKIVSEEPARAAMMAPTIITDEIAFVTDINGVWRDGVTLQTT